MSVWANKIALCRDKMPQNINPSPPLKYRPGPLKLAVSMQMKSK